MNNTISQVNMNSILGVIRADNTPKSNNANSVTATSSESETNHVDMAEMADAIRSANTSNEVDEELAKEFIADFDRIIKEGRLNTATAKFFALKDVVDGKITIEKLNGYSTIIQKGDKNILVKYAINEDGDYEVFSQEGSLEELEKLKEMPMKQLKVEFASSISTFLEPELISNFPKYYAKYHK